MASTSNTNNGEGTSTTNQPLPEPSIRNGSDVAHRRIFLGPMPEKVIAHTESQGKRTKLTIGSVFSLSLDPGNTHNTDRGEEVSRVLRDNAFRFFLHEGGKPEDWGAEEEEGMVSELLNRWKESEWGQLWTRRHHRKKEEQQVHDHWFGTSFEVGTLLGVNVLQGNEHIKTKAAPSASSKSTPTDIVAAVSGSVPPTGQEAFVAGPSNFSTAIPHPPVQKTDESLGFSLGNGESVDTPTPASSRTGLLARQADSDTYLQPDRKGKAKMVRYEDSLTNLSTATSEPAPPQDVLERTKSTVDPNTSLAAAITNESSASSCSELQWGNVVLKDRMLVRVSYTKSEDIIQFDDAINRTTRNLRYEDWGEFLVAWRKDNIEIYQDHSTPGKEWITGHKHLAYIIPLKSSRTRLSLYSFVDLTFSITCAPTTTGLNSSRSRWALTRDKEGTNIFIFKLKSRSRAYDWTWQLWRHMGGQVPTSLDIYNPGLSTKVTIDIPQTEADTAALYSTFTRENIINLCMESLRHVPDWKYLIEKEIKAGKSIQLAWRVGANVDWIWLEEDVCGNRRNWSVLCGIAFKQSARAPVLEVRLADHFPTHIHVKAGKHIEEPPSIEGYLDRIRPNTQTKQTIYLTSHSGNLFTLNTFNAFPPMPPGLASVSNLYTDAETQRHAEIRRGTNQILTATGVCDLRSVVVVRRASHPLPPHMHNEKEQTHDDTTWFGTWEYSSEQRNKDDQGDEGGEAGLNKFADRTQMRIMRSFELLLNTGNVVRFEAHSCQVASEWIRRLRDLIFYWKSRHRIDAKQEIELAQAQRARLTPQIRVLQDAEREQPPEAPADLSAPYAAMGTLYNWCILEGCKPLTKSGRLYVKKGLYGQYKHMQLFLIAGHLVHFRIGPHSSLYPAVRKKINLLDAYVCSGYLAAMTLPKGQYVPNAAPAPRRYQDGLETDDRDEDMLFVLWYRPQPQMINADHDPTTSAVDTKSVPRLSSKNKMLVFKTRSLLERDSWCWAINMEIEKIVRAQRSREESLRETGNLLKLE